MACLLVIMLVSCHSQSLGCLQALYILMTKFKLQSCYHNDVWVQHAGLQLAAVSRLQTFFLIEQNTINTS